jgi:hypothetical protein
MMARRRVEAERPWFVRSGPWWYCSLRPTAPAGWLLTGLYAAAIAGISIFFVARHEPRLVDFIIWATLLAASTFVYLLTAYRTSVRKAGGCGAHSKKRPSSSDNVRTLLLSLLAALAILGAAFLGVEL